MTRTGIKLDHSPISMVLLPCVIGVLTAGAAIGFVYLIAAVQWLAIGSSDLPLRVIGHVQPLRVILAPALGGLAVGLLVHRFAPEAQGHGVPEVIEAVTARGGRIRPRVAAIKSLASALTIGSGGSVGREGPIVQIGAAVGSTVAQALKLPSAQTRTLAACGAAGGIAAAFNAPIAGAFFALEVITGNFAMPSFGPVILSSVMATVASRAYFGDHPAFVVQPYALQSAYEIPLYVGLGLVSGLVAVGFVHVLHAIEQQAQRVPIAPTWKPALGGLAVGVLVLWLPNLYGVGYLTMDGALSGTLGWKMLAVLLPAKVLATSVTLGSGGSGGVFLPSLYLGAIAGGLYGTIVHSLLPSVTAGSGAYALVGMAGVLAAATHSPLTALILLFEISGDYKIILPVMLVVTLASLVSRSLGTDSLYSLALAKRGIKLHRREDVIMRTHTVGEVMRPVEFVLGESAPIGDVIAAFLTRGLVRAYVVDDAGKLAGEVSIFDIQDPEVRALGTLVNARDLATGNVRLVRTSDTLADCLDEFVWDERDELPAVDEAGKLAGLISRRDVLRVYTTELLTEDFLGIADHASDIAGVTRPRMASQVHLLPGLITERVLVPAALDGRSLRQADLRAAHGLTVVAVRRRGETVERLPDAGVPLAAGDTLVVVGTADDVARFRGRAGLAGTAPDDRRRTPDG